MRAIINCIRERDDLRADMLAKYHRCIFQAVIGGPEELPLGVLREMAELAREMVDVSPANGSDQAMAVISLGVDSLYASLCGLTVVPVTNSYRLTWRCRQ